MSANEPLWQDTDADSERRMLALYAAMTPGEKLQRVRELTQLASRFALARLAAEFPRESHGEHLLRLARVRLGNDLVNQAYGSR